MSLLMMNLCWWVDTSSGRGARTSFQIVVDDADDRENLNFMADLSVRETERHPKMIKYSFCYNCESLPR